MTGVQTCALPIFPILSQWEDHRNKNVAYIGPVFQNSNHSCSKDNPGHIFVTVGTRSESFARLLEAVEDLVKREKIKSRVIVQAGHTQYKSDYLEIFDFCTPDEIDQYIKNAEFVITQESAGIGTKCLKLKTPFLVMPRDYQFRELPAKSDMKEDLHLKLEEMGYTKVVTNRSELERAIRQIGDIKTGFMFDNRRAIAALNRLIGENPKQ